MDLLKITAMIDELQKDPGKFIADKLADPAIGPKIGEALSKMPPAVMETLAAAIAKYLPPPELPSADEIAASLANILPQGTESGIDIQKIVDTVKGQISVQVIEGYKKLNDTQLQLANAIKELQDKQESLIQSTVAATFKVNMNAIVEQINSQIQEKLAANPNPGVDSPMSQQPQSLIGQILSNLPTIIDAWQKLNPPQNSNVIETALKFYVQGLNQGNKLKTGESTTADAATDLLSLVQPKK
jgi:hypothetical protein